MLKIIVFHFTEQGRVPSLSDEEFKNLRKQFDETLRDYPGVNFTTWIDKQGKGVCIWDAPSVEVVKEIETKVIGSPPADPIVEVKQVL